MSKRNQLIVISLLVIFAIGGLLFWLLSPRQNSDWTCIAGQKAGPGTLHDKKIGANLKAAVTTDPDYSK